MKCSCPHLVIGTQVLKEKNWNPDCSEHGVKSSWYNSDEQIKLRQAQREKTTALQKLARLRRNKQISQETAQKTVKDIEKAYQDAIRRDT